LSIALRSCRSTTLQDEKWHGRGRRFEPDQVHQIDPEIHCCVLTLTEVLDTPYQTAVLFFDFPPSCFRRSSRQMRNNLETCHEFFSCAAPRCAPNACRVVFSLHSWVDRRCRG